MRNKRKKTKCQTKANERWKRINAVNLSNIITNIDIKIKVISLFNQTKVLLK